MTPCFCFRLRLAAPVLLLLSGCARLSEPVQTWQDPDVVQAQRQAMGRETSKAAPRLQLSLESAPPTADNAFLRPLAQAKTFLGTIPCPNDACEALRISLTLAPSGHWRARNTTLTLPPHTTVEQGCWQVIRQQPLRIALRTETQAVRADLGFVQNNVLRVYTYNGVQPTLEYRLTQQADIDAIAELQDQALGDCTPP